MLAKGNGSKWERERERGQAFLCGLGAEDIES
jgi:hypothetical protein